MVKPFVVPWIKKPDEFTCTRQNGPYIRSFMPITREAGEGQIIIMRCTAMLQTDDVINFAAKESIILVDQTVFAKPTRTISDQSAERFAKIATHC